MFSRQKTNICKGDYERMKPTHERNERRKRPDSGVLLNE
jgi:hypothetical protein